MAIYKMTNERLEKLPETSFETEDIRERNDLQRLLRNQIEIISADTLVIAEEFGEWEESRRRIDLLGVDKNGTLVVIELKRTGSGGHMELQALRYSALVSTMTFDDAVRFYQKYLDKYSPDKDADKELLNFLGWDEPKEDEFAQDVRIVLASADFSKELTSTVLWLNDSNLDISCVRLKPYTHKGEVLLDVQHIIPLPEAVDHQIPLKEKKQKERLSRKNRNNDLTKYDVTVGGISHHALAKRTMVYTVVKYLCENGITPENIVEIMPWRKINMFQSVEGTVCSEEFIAKVETMQNSIGNTVDAKRFYCDEEKLIHANDKTYAMSNGWGQDALKTVDLLIKEFPELDIEYHESD